MNLREYLGEHEENNFLSLEEVGMDLIQPISVEAIAPTGSTTLVQSSNSSSSGPLKDPEVFCGSVGTDESNDSEISILESPTATQIPQTRTSDDSGRGSVGAEESNDSEIVILAHTTTIHNPQPRNLGNSRQPISKRMDSNRKNNLKMKTSVSANNCSFCNDNFTHHWQLYKHIERNHSRKQQNEAHQMIQQMAQLKTTQRAAQKAPQIAATDNLF